MRITIFGATGNVGRHVCRHLSDSEQVTVRAVTRDRARTADIAHDEVAETDWTNEEQLRSALRESDAAFFMLPTGLFNGSLYEFRDEYSQAFLRAAQAEGVRRIVFMSSIGAHQSEKSGVLRGLNKAEGNLAAFDGELSIIRPGYFFQNFLGNVAGIKERGFFGGYPVDPDVSMLFADTSDIGRAAADLLTAETIPDHQVRYVGHPVTATFRELGDMLAQKSGRNGLVWVNVGYDAARKHMLGRGMPEEIVTNLIEFFDCINSGRAMSDFSADRLIKTETGVDAFTTRLSEMIRA